MKNIEDKLDSFEQVLAILIKKMSVLEELMTDRKVPVDNLARQMLAEILTNLKKMPSGNLMISEIYNCRRRIEALLDAQEHPRPVPLNFKSKGLILSGAMLIVTAAASLTTAKLIVRENDMLGQMAVRYEVMEKVAPELSKLLDSACAKNAELSIDSLRQIWERKNTARQQSKRKRTMSRNGS